MIHFVVAFAVLLHVAFWGAGAAILAMPRRWRRFWPVGVFAAGLALQSAVVWAGAKLGLRGTLSYAWWSEVVPVALLALALRRRYLRARQGTGGPPRERRDASALGERKSPRSPGQGYSDSFGRETIRAAVRAAWTDVGRFGVVWALVAGCLLLLMLPLALASKGLTTISLGSCDAADYAAGARVLLEFARDERTGFLGLTEVVRIASLDNFFDYWVRLNHFTPSALIAFNGAVLDCAPHELTTILTAVLLAGALPLAFWASRAVVGYSGGVSVIVAGVFGVSPLMWYAVAHVAPGQLIAAQAVVLVTWAGTTLWRGPLTWRRGAQFAGLLAIGYWLILGSYNFFVTLCLVPSLAFAGGLALWRRAWLRFLKWLALMLAPLAGCALVFFDRAAGLAERFTLFATYDFGWPIPALTAEGWLGMVQGPDLEAWSIFGARWILSACMVGVLGWAIIRAILQRRRALWLVCAITLPVLAGYVFLQARGARLGTNASYDAYKLFAVFYPLLLPAFCWWVTLRRSRRLHEWFFVAGVAAVVSAFNVAACGMFIWKLSRPPFLVDGQLRQLRKVEAMPDVKSVNLTVPDMWSRLWANSFLLHKEQFFPTHTYEGRLNTPLRGEWDLEGGLVSLHPGAGARRPITPRFALVDARHPRHLRVTLETGWHALEFIPTRAEQWRWTEQDAAIQIENAHPAPRQVRISLDARSVAPRTVTLLLNGAELPIRSVQLGVQRARHTFPPIALPPGKSTVVLHSREPAERAAPGDPRLLSACVFNLAVEVLEE